ncbi:MAG: hypothetical protein U9N45_06715, partial [Gemmatimonadota bacterium]|nr:hypothetical protein [Gemmatimonadota bacterium]
WGGTAEGVTGGDTIYFGNYSNLRKDTLALQGLCEEITAGLRGGLPDKAETLLAAGRMYRRSADYVKAGEYFLRVLDLVYKRSECA